MLMEMGRLGGGDMGKNLVRLCVKDDVKSVGLSSEGARHKDIGE